MQDQPVPQPQQAQVDIAVVQSPTKLVCILGGKYIGSVTFDAASPDALGALAQIFQQYATQMRGGIQVANGAGIPGIEDSVTKANEFDVALMPTPRSPFWQEWGRSQRAEVKASFRWRMRRALRRGWPVFGFRLPDTFSERPYFREPIPHGRLSFEWRTLPT